MTSAADTARGPTSRALPALGRLQGAAAVGVLAAAGTLALSPLPLWARSVRDVVGNGFARIVHDAPAWSILVAPWIPVGLAAAALAGLAAAGAWLAARRTGGSLPLTRAWLAFAMVCALSLAAPLLPGVLDAYRGPRGFHEMHLGPLYWAALALSVLGLAAAAYASLRGGSGRASSDAR
ncbi:MAG TPA: hypothetical protein VHK06_07570 [Candidatus Limnocylindria bacterium]|nr:hypothetical protein [Candidatus Limnocylindria bacterium]